MVAANREICIKRVLVHEGGYTNDPRDPGGPTNWGITIFDARKYWRPNATAADVRVMPQSVAVDIYRQKYWVANGLSCDDLPGGVDDSLDDYRVNSGVGRADKVLRRVCGIADNAPNAVLLAAVAKRDPKALINAINDERLRFLQSLHTWPHFGKGWGTRVAEVRAFSLALADQKAVALPEPKIVVQGAGKGKVKPPVTARKVVIGGGAVATGTSASTGHWLLSHPEVTAAILVGGGCLVLGGIAYLERRHTARQEAPTPGLVPVPPLPQAA